MILKYAQFILCLLYFKEFKKGIVLTLKDLSILNFWGDVTWLCKDFSAKTFKFRHY